MLLNNCTIILQIANKLTYRNIVMKYTKIRAFSLIEMLIVISISAILAAIAYAQYKNYTIRSKITQAMIIFSNIGEKAKAYYDSHGTFPNLQQVDLYYDPLDPTQSPMASNLNEYIANYVAYTFLNDQSINYTCPSAAYGGYISNLQAGDFATQTQTGSLITVNQLLVYVDKTYKNYCQYYYYLFDPDTQNLTPQSGNFVPACTNGTDDPNNANFFSDAGNQC